MQIERYEPSGRNGSAGLLVPLLGFPILALLSVAYSYIAVYIPFTGVVTFLLLGGYVFAAGFTLGVLGKFAKCRNRATMHLLGLAGGVICLWLAWVFFLLALINRNDDVKLIDLLLDPGGMWRAICAINESGWYSIKSATPSGIVLWAFWLIEALVIVGGVSLLAPMMIADEMFCETCNGWCQVKETKYLKIDLALANAKLDAIEIPPLFTLPSGDAKVYPSIRLELLQCPQCSISKGLRFVRLTMVADKDGDKSEHSENLPGIYLPPAAK